MAMAARHCTACASGRPASCPGPHSVQHSNSRAKTSLPAAAASPPADASACRSLLDERRVRQRACLAAASTCKTWYGSTRS